MTNPDRSAVGSHLANLDYRGGAVAAMPTVIRSRFVELAIEGGKTIAVNPEHVVTISDYDSAPGFPETLVVLLTGEIRVKGEYAVVKAALEKA